MLQKSKVEPRQKSRESRFLRISVAARLFGTDTEVRGRSCVKRYGPSRREARDASAVLTISVHQSKKTFATWGNSGIEPDKGKGISSPGMYEARLMRPCNDGERQWNTMSDWTYR